MISIGFVTVVHSQLCKLRGASAARITHPSRGGHDLGDASWGMIALFAA